VDTPIELIGTFDTTLAREFFAAVAANAGMTLHLHLVSGENAHHIIEATFKAFAVALREAVAIDPRVGGVPSTKGSL
jgi:imidazoleglycerol-phosphate dehydratase